MTKQLWVLCKSTTEEKELISMLPGFYVDLGTKPEFPLIVDKTKKLIFRCESVSCCAAYVSTKHKMLSLQQLKDLTNKE